MNIKRLASAAASLIAANVAAFVGSEMLEQVPKVRHERSFLAAFCLVTFFGVWACWEWLQVRQNLQLTSETHGPDIMREEHGA